MRKLTLLLVALALLLVAAPQAARAQTAANTATLRVIHAAAGAPGIDVYVDGQRVLESRDYFSEGSLSLAPGQHDVVVVAEGQSAASPLVGKRVTVRAGEAFTLAVVGERSNVRGLLLKDRDASVASGEARVRIIHAAAFAGPVDVAVAGGEPFLQDAVFGSAAYVDAPAGTYAFDLSNGATGAALLRTLELNLVPGWTYTLVVTGSSPQTLWVQALVDRTTS